MNLHDYILGQGLADTDPGEIAAGYIAAVRGLAPDAQLAALEPSVRPHASRLASTIRRAQRASGGPAHAPDENQDIDGGPAQVRNDNQEVDGGPAQASDGSHARYGGPAAPAWMRQNAQLIAWCRDHQSDHYWIPGAGRRKLAEITALEWEARARWLTQQAEGAARSAGQVRAFAALIEAAGAETLHDVLQKAEAS